MRSPVAFFVADRATAEELAAALGCDYIAGHLSHAERTAAIERFGTEGYECLVCTPAAVTGWRGPKNMKTFFMDGFPRDPATRKQAANRAQI